MQPESTWWDQMTTFYLSAFHLPGLDPRLVLLGIGLGVAFGGVWLMAYRPPLANKPALLFLAAGSALLTWTAIAFVQLPLQAWWEQGSASIWGMSTVLAWLLIAGVPTMLVSGLVQEGAKLLCVVAYRSLSRAAFDAKAGLFAGAIAGAGFGVFEAVWVHNSVLAAGLNWQAIQADPFVVLPFVERFFAVGIHVALAALAGYGLAKGMAWRYFLLAGSLHGLANYVSVLQQSGVLDKVGVELYVVAFTAIVSAVVLRLRWRRTSSGQGAGPAGTSAPVGLGQTA